MTECRTDRTGIARSLHLSLAAALALALPAAAEAAWFVDDFESYPLTEGMAGDSEDLESASEGVWVGHDANPANVVETGQTQAARFGPYFFGAGEYTLAGSDTFGPDVKLGMDFELLEPGDAGGRLQLVGRRQADGSRLLVGLLVNNVGEQTADLSLRIDATGVAEGAGEFLIATVDINDLFNQAGQLTATFTGDQLEATLDMPELLAEPYHRTATLDLLDAGELGMRSSRPGSGDASIFQADVHTFTVVPEPGTAGMVGAALAGWLAIRRRK